MKYLLFALALLVSFSALEAAVSVEDVARLSELKTGDQLIIELIRKEGLSAPIGTKEVILLRERGVSEKVIEVMLEQSHSKIANTPEKAAEPSKLSENIRTYYATGKDGSRVLMATNLDEKGNRMGPPAPPPMETYEPETTYKESQIPREITVTVRHEGEVTDRGRYRDEYEDEYYEEPYGGGIPVYGSAYGGYPYYGYSAPYACPSGSFCPRNDNIHVNPFGATGNYNFSRPSYVPKHTGFRNSFRPNFGHRGFSRRPGTSFQPRTIVNRPMSAGVKR
jgi:hypothetical protein